MNIQNYPTWLVPLEIAKKLKEIGFDEPCIFSYSEGIGITACLRSGSSNEPLISDFIIGGNTPKSPFTDLPTWEQVLGWFRQKGFESYISKDDQSYIDEGSYYFYTITNEIGGEIDVKGDFDDYNVVREALVKALIQAYKSEQYKIIA